MLPFGKVIRLTVQVVLVGALMGCAGPQVASGIYDPYEAQNRRTHEFNRQIDKALLKPVSGAYGKTLPEPVRIGVGNFASNLSLPGAVLNDLLQLNIEDALHNTVRFVVNSTIGLGGILDPAMAGGVEARDTDFGETLHVWGVSEGAYVELPFAGPSTSRDALGLLVDVVIDPVNKLLPRSRRYIVPVASLAAKVGDRYRFRSTVDSILYESADSYAQARLLYLENRRFELGVSAPAEDDLYEGLYDDLTSQ